MFEKINSNDLFINRQNNQPGVQQSDSEILQSDNGASIFPNTESDNQSTLPEGVIGVIASAGGIPSGSVQYRMPNLGADIFGKINEINDDDLAKVGLNRNGDNVNLIVNTNFTPGSNNTVKDEYGRILNVTEYSKHTDVLKNSSFDKRNWKQFENTERNFTVYFNKNNPNQIAGYGIKIDGTTYYFEYQLDNDGNYEGIAANNSQTSDTQQSTQTTATPAPQRTGYDTNNTVVASETKGKTFVQQIYDQPQDEQLKFVVDSFKEVCKDISPDEYSDMPGNISLEYILKNYDRIPSDITRSCIAKIINNNPEKQFKDMGINNINALYMLASGESAENVQYCYNNEVPTNNPNFTTLSKLGISYEDIANSKSTDDGYELSNGSKIKVSDNKVEYYNSQGKRDLNKEVTINLVNNNSLSLNEKISYLQGLEGQLDFDALQFNNIFQNFYKNNCSATQLKDITEQYQRLTGKSPKNFSNELGQYLDDSEIGNSTQLEIFISELADIIGKEENTNSILQLENVLSAIDMTYGNDIIPNALAKLFEASYRFKENDETAYRTRNNTKLGENIYISDADFINARKNLMGISYSSIDDMIDDRLKIINRYNNWSDLCENFYYSLYYEDLTQDEVVECMHTFYKLMFVKPQN